MLDLKYIASRIIIALFAVSFLMFIFFGVPYILSYSSCAEKWSGFRYEYTVLGGCKVDIGNGLMPERAIRFNKEER